MILQVRLLRRAILKDWDPKLHLQGTDRAGIYLISSQF